jgi:hypothetical protein
VFHRVFSALESLTMYVLVFIDAKMEDIKFFFHLCMYVCMMNQNENENIEYII